MLQCTPVYCSFCLTIACSELPILYIHLQLFLSYSNLLSIGLSLDQLGISCPCQHASCMFYLSTSAWLHFALFSIYSNVRQESCAFRLEKTLSMGSLLMERIFQSIPNRVLMVHTEWLPSVRLRHFSPTCAVLHIEDCGGWWLSSCRSSVSEHWLHKLGVLDSIPGGYQFPLFHLKTSNSLYSNVRQESCTLSLAS